MGGWGGTLAAITTPQLLTALARLPVVAHKAAAAAAAAVAKARVAALGEAVRSGGIRGHIHPRSVRGARARGAVGRLVQRNVRGGAPAIVAQAAGRGGVAGAVPVAPVEVAAPATQHTMDSKG